MNSIVNADNNHIPLPDGVCDSCVTDPPYGYSFMGNKWDYSVPSIKQWIEIMRVMKPGAFLLSFSSPRTYHRMAVNIEDAGFDIKDSIEWIYGSGFPKQQNLKPAHEPICLARKPFVGPAKRNKEIYGTGILNIDACRIPTDETIQINKLESWSGFGQVENPEYSQEINTAGRWPANLMLDEFAANELDKQTGTLKSGKMLPTHKVNTDWGYHGGERAKPTLTETYGDEGGASRFFYVAKATKQEKNAGVTVGEKFDTFRPWCTEESDRSVAWVRITSKKGKNNHPTVKPILLMRELVKLVTPPGGLVIDPFCGSGSTGCAAALEGFNFFGCDLDYRYSMIAKQRKNYWIKKYQPNLFDLENKIEKDTR